MNVKPWIRRSWDEAAEGYTSGWAVRELDEPGCSVWTGCLLEGLPERRMDILDVGTGTGTMAILCARMGHRVTGIDISDRMLDEARRNSGEEGLDIGFRCMDAEDLDFPDGSFDLVVSRGAFWCIPDPSAAYSEALRVLAPGGRMRVFDGSHPRRGPDHDPCAVDRRADEDYRASFGAERMKLYSDYEESRGWVRSLSMTYEPRPEYDLGLMRRAGFEDIQLSDLTDRAAFDRESRFYNRDRMYFRIEGTKPLKGRP